MLFRNRRHAGSLLAQKLNASSLPDPIVIALPRGGVPISYEIACSLRAPLEVLVVRKVGAPVHLEYGIGAITEEGYYWIDPEAARATGATSQQIQRVLDFEYQELQRRVRTYRGKRSLPPLKGKSVIVVDDGLATGVTARVASHYLKARGAHRIVLAIPVCSPRTTNFLRSELEDVVCLKEPEGFFSIGQFYEDFTQTSDEEVISLLSQARYEFEQSTSSQKDPSSDHTCFYEEVLIESEDVSLPGNLAIPKNCNGIVLFSQGSGSGKFSPRNRQVAQRLNHGGLGTLLFDLLTEAESLDRKNVFDMPLLMSRLVLATQWLKNSSITRDLPVGYFGASTGAGAALWAAANLGGQISAVVSRGGRPDLAIPKLSKVTAPTLLMVGENDESVIRMNQEAMKHLTTSNLIIVPKATHLFEEPGALEMVSEEATRWFSKYLQKRSNSP